MLTLLMEGGKMAISSDELADENGLDIFINPRTTRPLVAFLSKISFERNGWKVP